MPGSWIINADGSLLITRVRSENGGYTENCRYAETEGCVLFHERTLRLLGQKDNEYSLFHKHDFKLTNLSSDNIDVVEYFNISLYKLDTAPVVVSASTTNNSVKHQPQTLITIDNFRELDPELQKYK